MLPAPFKPPGRSRPTSVSVPLYKSRLLSECLASTSGRCRTSIRINSTNGKQNRLRSSTLPKATVPSVCFADGSPSGHYISSTQPRRFDWLWHSTSCRPWLVTHCPRAFYSAVHAGSLCVPAGSCPLGKIEHNWVRIHQPLPPLECLYIGVSYTRAVWREPKSGQRSFFSADFALG